MTDDRPTTPAPRRRVSEWVRSAVQFIDIAKWVGTTLASVCAALFAANAWIENHVTEAELALRLKPIDANAAALLDRLVAEQETLRAQAVLIEAQRKELDRTRLDLQWSWWWWTRVRQAELEHSRDPRKVERAADAAGDRFDAFVRQGMTFEEAHRRAVRRGLP